MKKNKKPFDSCIDTYRRLLEINDRVLIILINCNINNTSDNIEKISIFKILTDDSVSSHLNHSIVER